MAAMNNVSTPTYNIPIKLASLGNYSVSELSEKLMEYALMLVGTSSKDNVLASEMPYKFEVLEGFLNSCASLDDLRSEYIVQKYGV